MSIRNTIKEAFLQQQQQNIDLSGRDNIEFQPGANSNVLFGGEGDDVLTGGSGNDILVGSRSNPQHLERDTYVGGSGADTFVLASFSNANRYGSEIFRVGPAYWNLAENANIVDFDATEGDKILVFGSVDNYSFEQATSRSGIVIGIDIINKQTNTRIAFVSGVTELDPTVDVSSIV